MRLGCCVVLVLWCAACGLCLFCCVDNGFSVMNVCMCISWISAPCGVFSVGVCVGFSVVWS